MQTKQQQKVTRESRNQLAFIRGNKKYGIDIHKVQEICGHSGVTTTTLTPAFIKGVISQRGITVPIAGTVDEQSLILSDIGDMKISCDMARDNLIVA